MQERRLNDSTSDISIVYLVLLVSLYFVINGLTIIGGVQIAAFAFLIVLSLLFYKNNNLNSTDFLWLLSVVPFTYIVKTWTVACVRDFVAYLAFVIFVVKIRTKPELFNRPLKLLFSMSLFHLVFVFINVIFKTQYQNLLYAVMSPTAIPTYNYAVKGNYYTGFGYIPGDTSGYLVDGVLLIVFLNGLLKRKHRALTAALLMLGIMFCAKKSHILCLVLTIAITWVMCSSDNGSGSKRRNRIVIAILAMISILTLGYILLPFFTNIPMINRISIAVEKYVSGADYTSNRTNLSNIAVHFFNENKTFGIGWKTFNQYTYHRWGKSNYVNNVYLQLAAETGIVGSVLFISPMFFNLISTIKKINAVRKLQQEKAGQITGEPVNNRPFVGGSFANGQMINRPGVVMPAVKAAAVGAPAVKAAAVGAPVVGLQTLEGQNQEEKIGIGTYLKISFAFQVFYLLYCFFEIPFYDYTFLFIYALALVISNSISYDDIAAEQAISNQKITE